MLIRRLAGVVGIVVAAWMLWETVNPVMRQISFGSDFGTELLNPPTTLLRFIATPLMIIGGVAAALNVRGGAYLFTAGALVFAVLTGALVGSRADYTLWRDEAVLAPFLMVICGVLVFTHRN
ncbi:MULTISPECIES: hypothetical protein [Henriciella]|jgi:hypothetical protein|uniref:DoxX family protein n=1 Tax=Henriciella pelagia TaxID=1977912 RepID=A0ABQ1JKE7_9PROT|nr:hypothetical protein [Henriciella pelagia]GGB68964.1 hypothetical protein GCM10011503_16980 [Henriciella pelagia]